MYISPFALKQAQSFTQQKVPQGQNCFHAARIDRFERQAAPSVPEAGRFSSKPRPNPDTQQTLTMQQTDGEILMTVRLELKRLPHGADLAVPAYQSDLAAGLDLQAAVEEMIVLDPGQRVLVPTGLAMAIPAGFEGQVRPRSGLAARHGVTVLNTPGTIDADYRGEVKVILINLGDVPFQIERGARIAQLVIAPVHQAQIVEVGDLSETDRGGGGFGSTGS
jgi:dUTP pyrophosphatase